MRTHGSAPSEVEENPPMRKHGGAKKRAGFCLVKELAKANAKDSYDNKTSDGKRGVCVGRA